MTLKLTPDGFFLHLWRENQQGERVYPCVITRNGETGLQVTLTPKRSDYHTVDLDTLLDYLATGRLGAVGRIRMKPRRAGASASGFAISSAEQSPELEAELRRRAAVASVPTKQSPRVQPAAASIDFADLVRELNDRAADHPVGLLQSVRQRLKGRRASAGALFTRQTTFDDYAFHTGGRTELQFNVGIEPIDEAVYLRHGVAFSLEPSRTVPDPEVLVPKVRRFNEFMRLNPEEYADMRLWHYRGVVRSQNHSAAPVPSDWVQSGVFICLGKLQSIEGVDFELILSDFDRLLPLYEFVEGTDDFPALAPGGEGFQFRPGCQPKPARTARTVAERELDVTLRHNELQSALYDILSARFGADAVGTELINGSAARVDVVARRPDGYWYYEIKTASSARACIREALAQLLEYSYWPGTQTAERLVVVGEPVLDAEAEAYLALLRNRFGLPVYYQQLLPTEGVLHT